MEDKSRLDSVQRYKLSRRALSRRVKKAEVASARHAKRFVLKRLDNVRSVRRRVIGWLVLVGLIIACVGVQLGWYHDEYITKAEVSGGTFAEASLGDIETLNPLYAHSGPEVAASRLLFSTLYTYDNTGHLRGDLADEMNVGDENKTYTVTLKNNAKWHDGTRVTAEDVAYTIDLIKNSASRSALRASWQDVSVRAVDNVRVEFRLPAIYAAFPHALTFPILPKHVLAHVAPGALRESAFSQAPVGSGPFVFGFNQRVGGDGHTIVQLQANKSYYRGAPRLDRFEVHAYDKPERLVRSLTSGEVNAAADIDTSSISEKDAQKMQTLSYPVYSGVYALLNSMKGSLKDATVRKALQLATDTRAIRKNIGSGVIALDLPYVASLVNGSTALGAPAHSRQAAMVMLDQAGWKLEDKVRQKDNTPLQLNIVTAKESQYEKAAHGIAEQWRSIGVGVDVTVVDRSSPGANFTQDILQPRNYDVLVYELSIGGDPDVYAYWHSSQIGSSGYNFANYRSHSVDTALASARSRTEPALRDAKYISFAKQWLEDVPAIGLYQPTLTYAIRNGPHAVRQGSLLVTTADRYADVVDWTVRTGNVYKTP